MCTCTGLSTAGCGAPGPGAAGCGTPGPASGRDGPSFLAGDVLNIQGGIFLRITYPSFKF